MDGQSWVVMTEELTDTSRNSRQPAGSLCTPKLVSAKARHSERDNPFRAWSSTLITVPHLPIVVMKDVLQPINEHGQSVVAVHRDSEKGMQSFTCFAKQIALWTVDDRKHYLT